MSLFYNKYLKYKNKYLGLKNQSGGAAEAEDRVCQAESAAVCMCPLHAPKNYQLVRRSKHGKFNHLPKDFSNLLESRIKQRHELRDIKPSKPSKPSHLINLSNNDAFSHIIEIMDYPDIVSLLMTNSDMVKKFDFNILHSDIDRKFNFKPIQSKLESIRTILFKTQLPSIQRNANLYLNKLRLIIIYNKLMSAEEKELGEVFDEKLIYSLLMKSIIFNYETEAEEISLRSNQDYLTLLLPPEMVIKEISSDMFIDYISEDYKVTMWNGSYETFHPLLPTLIIPNSVELIKPEGFVNAMLKKLTLPNNLTHIGEMAFQTNQLKKIKIPDSVIYIGDGAFMSNKLTELSISKSISRIEKFTFVMNLLTEVKIPNSVTYIGSNAFASNRLESVVIPDSVTSIDDLAFATNKLESIEIPDSVTLIGSRAFAWNKLKRVKIPDSVISIGNEAFRWNPSIDKDSFPEKFKKHIF